MRVGGLYGWGGGRAQDGGRNRDLGAAEGKVLGRSLLSKGKGRGGEEGRGVGVGKHDKWMLESQIQEEGGPERGWADDPVSPIGSPGPG